MNNGDFVVISTSDFGYGILAQTSNGFSPLSIENHGDFAVTASGGEALGIKADTFNGFSPVSIVNSGDFTVTSIGDFAYGIRTSTSNGYSPISIDNSGDFAITASQEALGIRADTFNGHSPISIKNSGDFAVTSTGDYAYGIRTSTFGGNSLLSIDNSGDFTVTAAEGALGIRANTFDGNSPPSIVNSGNFAVTGVNRTLGIRAETFDGHSPISIENSGDFVVIASVGSTYGLYARTFDGNSAISLVNSGTVVVEAGGPFANATGINARTDGDTNSPLSIVNSGDVTATATRTALGIAGETRPDNSPLSIVNSGDITTSAYGEIFEPLNGGIFADTFGFNSPLSLVNSGHIKSKGEVGRVFGIYVDTRYNGGPLSIVNSGDITVDSRNGYAYGIRAFTGGMGSPLSIVNSGDIRVGGNPHYAVGIYARTRGLDSPLVINNSGSVFGRSAGIRAYTKYGGTTIFNTGKISAGNFLAIDAKGASTTIYNGGTITGFVSLTDNNDALINQPHGVWITKLTSYFGEGSDIVQNLVGGTVQAATNGSVKETSAIVGLERFENKGLITLQDDAAGDIFEIKNRPFVVGHPGPEAYNGVYFYSSGIEFNGSDKSQLAVDAFLGKPGSESDIFIIDGDVTGKTKVDVNNTNAGPGVFNPKGIPVVFVGGNVKSDAFFLSQPIDTGFFNYDLFFKPTGSGVFELKSFLGQGAFVLPQLETAMQDMWHQGSDTWFDRTADLRVLLNGGAAPAEDPNAKYAEGTPAPQNFTPAVWARGSGDFLNRDDTEHVTAYGRDYSFNLNRDLQTVDFQSGIDLGKRGLLSDNDILVFGALGGFIHSDLDYDAINRIFSFNGGQVGGYATYLRGGLFVDTLVNVHLLQLDTRTLGFPNSLNATTVGVRTDSGYRFGSFHGGAFIEPLATISVDWADIDGFSQGGNKVSFNNDANVQGRLGLRVGTTTQLWQGITAEPFVIGSLWGNLSNDNQATLVSTGTTFILEDHLEDVWGEVSGGVNFFNPTASTSVFAKVDVTFGQDIDGVGGKAGMRVSW